MSKYEITWDIVHIYRTEIEADSIEEAKEKALAISAPNRETLEIDCFNEQVEIYEQI